MEVNKLLKLRRNNKIWGKIIEIILLKKGICIPKNVVIGKNVKFPHNGLGTVLHPNTIIDDNVIIYQNVTLGRADVFNSYENSKMTKIHIKSGAIICAGAKVLCKEGTLIVGKNSVVAANAVLLHSIPDNEIWGGIPAKKIGERNKE